MGILIVRLMLSLVFLVSIYLNASEAQTIGKLAHMTVPQIITYHGYPVEKHRVKTEDGYVLQMHRIPAGRRTARRTPTAKGKPAIIIVHGLLGQSGDFVVMGPERSLAYILADAGYDIWLANLRGNDYTAHKNLTRNDPAFWDYSFHEHGKYDTPAMIDKVLKVTGLQKILYIGYSMGTTTFFTMMAQRPEYNDKLIAFVALAPAVYMDNVKELSEFGLKTVNFTQTMRSQGVYSLSFSQSAKDMLISSVCGNRRSEDVCMRVVYAIVGEDYEEIDWDIAPVMLARFQPASWRQLEHFGKIAITGVFTSWEDGLDGAVKPYNLANIRIPVTLVYGENDKLTEKSQIQRLANELNSTGALEEMTPACAHPKFNHLDFTFARNVGKMMNKPLIAKVDSLFNKYYFN